MVFGQGDSKKSVYILNTIVGIIGFVICVFNCFVVCKHPAFQKGGEFYTDPNVFVLISFYIQAAPAEVSEAPAKKPTATAAPKKKPVAYEDNPFDSSSDDDIPTASVPGAKKAKAQNKKKKAVVDNPFEDDNPFDD